MAKKSKGGKNKQKKASAKSSASALPKLSNLHRKVHEAVPTPSSLPQWAIVLIILLAAAVVLLALQGSITGAFHAGANDTVKLSDVKFIPFRMGITYAGYSGRVVGIRVSIGNSPQSGLAFKFGNNYTTNAYYVTRQIDPTGVPVGSIMYSAGGTWQFGQRGYGRIGSSNYLYTSRSAGLPWLLLRTQAAGQVVMFDLQEQNEAALYANGSIDPLRNYQFSNHWIIGWNNSLPMNLVAASLNPVNLTGVEYQMTHEGAVGGVDVGYVSPMESTYLSNSNPFPYAVTIRYAYDTRLR